MEIKAYNEARNKFCIPERKNGRVSMTELFDMIAGSETGAIIGAALNIKDENTGKSKFYANDLMKWFEANSDTLYRDSQMPVILKIAICVVFIGVICTLVFLGVDRRYKD